MTVFDAHAHVIVPELLRDAGGGETWRPRVDWRDGRQVVTMDGREMLSAVREFVDLYRVLADRQTVGIDRVLLCPWVGLLSYDVPAAAGLDAAVCRTTGWPACAPRSRRACRFWVRFRSRIPTWRPPSSRR